MGASAHKALTRASPAPSERGLSDYRAWSAHLHIPTTALHSLHALHDYLFKAVPGKPKLEVRNRNSTSQLFWLISPSYLGTNNKCEISLLYNGKGEAGPTIISDLMTSTNYSLSVSWITNLSTL